MRLKLFFKISVLVFGLVMVVSASQYFSSLKFQDSLDQVFNVPTRAFQWCSGRAENFRWVAKTFADKYQAVSAAALSKKFCTVYMEQVQGVDIKKVAWTTLAEGQDSGGQAVRLEWNAEHQLFRAAGLPFKSSALVEELSRK